MRIFARWCGYGYLGALAGWIVLLGVFAAKDGRLTPYLTLFGYGLIWAVPWSIATGICGQVSKVNGTKATLALTAVGIIGGVVYDVTESGLVDGWLALTLPAHCIPAMLAANLIPAACLATVPKT